MADPVPTSAKEEERLTGELHAYLQQVQSCPVRRLPRPKQQMATLLLLLLSELRCVQMYGTWKEKERERLERASSV